MFEDVAKKVKAAHEKTEAKVNARIKEEQEKLMDMIKVRGKITWVKNNHELPPGDEFDMAERWRNVASTVQREMLLSLADSDVSCWKVLFPIKLKCQNDVVLCDHSNLYLNGAVPHMVYYNVEVFRVAVIRGFV